MHHAAQSGELKPIVMIQGQYEPCVCKTLPHSNHKKLSLLGAGLGYGFKHQQFLYNIYGKITLSKNMSFRFEYLYNILKTKIASPESFHLELSKHFKILLIPSTVSFGYEWRDLSVSRYGNGENFEENGGKQPWKDRCKGEMR